MPRRKSKATAPLTDYRHKAKRKNIPPAGLAAQGQVRETPKLQFAYDPHLPPMLRFDPEGKPDTLPPLLAKALQKPLSKDEAALLAVALQNHEPWLEWAGKREKKGFEADPIALHIHERISAQAILRIAARESVQRDLFADPQLEYQKAIQFYQHDVDWANRMILGDSLQVMASLARREDLAGKVQMIYVDPPYGIKFSSNFQPEIGRRDVKDKESDLTREPEMVKAYRDTWTLGVHSYLSYLRDRLWLCKELLADSGSIFVQIGDENVHVVRSLLDEVFTKPNFVAEIFFRKTGAFPSETIASVADIVLWYAKRREMVKVRHLFGKKGSEGVAHKGYDHLEMSDGSRRRLDDEEMVEVGSKIYSAISLESGGWSDTGSTPFEFQGESFTPRSNAHWKTNAGGLKRLSQSNRIVLSGRTLRYVMYQDDFPVLPMTNMWADVMGATDVTYVVQTNALIVQRCLLMTTDPGDLVLDPTCGSGTTAYVAEQWGRRWITIDTSRVALALARQRLLTARFDFCKFKDETKGVSGGFICKTVPHITLKSIAQNVALDAIFAKHQPVLDAALASLNDALKKVSPESRQRLKLKLLEKEKREGRKSVTDADRRRWLLPGGTRAVASGVGTARRAVRSSRGGATGGRALPEDETTGWREWEVPFDSDPDWPKPLQDALSQYRAAWRAKMDEVNAAISANAEQEELVDQPEKISGVVRVSGPFTMEAVMPAEESLEEATPIGGEPEEMETFGEKDEVTAEPQNAEAFLDMMLRLLRSDGVRFPNNKVARFTRLEPCSGEWLHAEGEWSADPPTDRRAGNGKVRRVAVSIGPQFGPVTAYQVENALHSTSRRGFDDLVFAGFSFDGAAQAIIQEDPNPRVRCHLAHIRPDVTMGDLLKETPSSQIFTVFGSPRTNLKGPDKEGLYVIEMEGVDIYDPVGNTLLPTNADKVAAWFVDSDYDGSTFCITQAFFPDKSAWRKLARALKGVIDEERFAALSGTVSLPFPAGEHKRAAVKVIDPRGNEVMRVHRLGGKTKY